MSILAVQPTTQKHRWLLPVEAADLLRVSPNRLCELVKQGCLVKGVHYSKPPGMGRRFNAENLEAWLAGDRPRIPPPGSSRGKAGCKVNMEAAG